MKGYQIGERIKISVHSRKINFSSAYVILEPIHEQICSRPRGRAPSCHDIYLLTVKNLKVILNDVGLPKYPEYIYFALDRYESIKDGGTFWGYTFEK